MNQRMRVAVLFGGRSGEHEVSIMSARSVMAALDPQKYEVIPVGITRQGAWIIGADPMRALECEDFSAMHQAALFGDPSKQGLWAEAAAETAVATREAPSKEMRLATLAQVDVIFPVLHGTFGEDGTVQGLLELAGAPYVGAGVLASALGMDKIAFKALCRAEGLPVADYVSTTRRRWEADPDAVMDEVETQLAYPLFTKPANLGSSVGISKCRNRAELRHGLAEAARYDRRILIEVGVPAAREIEVSVLGNDAPIASVPGEVIPSREFYDYAAKYLDRGEDASELIIPAALDAATTALVRDLALRAYRAADCSGMARVDFLLNAETGEVFIGEINTIPGFTMISMYPKLWEASGLSYKELLDRLIELALERHTENVRSEHIYRPAATE